MEDFVDDDETPSADEDAGRRKSDAGQELGGFLYDDLQASLSLDFLAGFDSCFGLDMASELTWADTPTWLAEKQNTEAFPRSRSSVMYKHV